MTDPTHETHPDHARISRGTPHPAESTDTARDPQLPHDLDPVPDPIGDVVPGDPPVPITVWHLPRPSAHAVVSAGLTRRLIVNYTRPGGLVVDLISGARLSTPVQRDVALIITGWPLGQTTASAHLTACAGRLQPEGCLAIVITATETPDQLGDLISAARAAGLTYLQHIVVAHQLNPGAAAGEGPDRERPTANRRRHLRVHTDLLILRAGRGARG